MFEGFSEKLINVGDVSISCTVGGSGIPLLLLHGYPQCKALWARVAPILAERYTVICADLRGYGDSSKPHCLPDNSNYSFRTMAGDQVKLMAALGFQKFHAIGHDRGGRTAYRMALDHPDAVLSLTVMDIVPTYTMFMGTNRKVAGAYWHWYFLSQPEPFPERLISADPDYFYETSIVGWGSSKIDDFDQEMIAAYRRAWRDPGMIHGSTSDYRAAATIDLEHDKADIGRVVSCPSLVYYGETGAMARLFHIPAEWRGRLSNMRQASSPGGHFFIDAFPKEVAATLSEFISSVTSQPKRGGDFV